MVTRFYITRNLRSLNRKYVRSKTQAEPLYYSKLAIIELCGWIETSMDEIFEANASKFVNEVRHLIKFRAQLKKTYGFNEKKHLQPLIVALVGNNGLEKLDASCDTRLMGALHRNLNELSIMRNSLAHTYIKGFAVTIESPQLILRRLDQVANGLDHFEEQLDLLSVNLQGI
jgi:hypothetical protein